MLYVPSNNTILPPVDGELERAVEMGENAYNEIKNAPSQDEINAMLMLQIAECRVKGRC
jgi:hypothetical protein